MHCFLLDYQWFYSLPLRFFSLHFIAPLGIFSLHDPTLMNNKNSTKPNAFLWGQQHALQIVPTVPS